MMVKVLGGTISIQGKNEKVLGTFQKTPEDGLISPKCVPSTFSFFPCLDLEFTPKSFGVIKIFNGREIIGSGYPEMNFTCAG
jgi:hypothetical protein